MALRPLPNPTSSPATTRAVLAAADQARLRRYAEYLEFYDGKQWAKPRQGRSSLVLNYARAIVDKGVSYLLGRGINFAVAPAGPSPEEQARARAAEELLYRVYEENDLEAVDVQGALNGAILGDTVFKVFWEQGAKGRGDGEDGGRIRVVSIDPFTFFPRWAGDDPSTLLSASLVYRLSGEEAERRYGGGGTQRRGDVEVAEEWTPSQLVLAVGDREVVRTPNPYGFIPFVHIPNARPANEFWGTSDLKDVVPLNRELNERMSDMADVIRFHSDPPVIFKGVTEHSSLVVGPGTVWDVPEGAEVGLLEWRGQAPAVHEHIERVMRAIHDVTETPKTAFGDSGRLLSGVALETELQPLIQKTLRKRAWWNVGLRQRSRQILRIAELKGLGRFDPYRSRVIWPPLLPADSEGEVRNNVALVAAGLRSRRTAMDRLGEESPEAELELIREEAHE
ncbi:MAG: phage portal protein [Chloroflexota bacterium]